MKINLSFAVSENVFSFAFLNFYCHLLFVPSLFSSYMTMGLVLSHVFVFAQVHRVAQQSTLLYSSTLSAHVRQVPYWFEHALWLLAVMFLMVLPGL